MIHQNIAEDNPGMTSDWMSNVIWFAYFLLIGQSELSFIQTFVR